MKTYINKKTVIIFCTALCCILLLWSAGLGFGNEIRLSKILGITFLGSALYLGIWFTFLAMSIIGFVIPYLIIRFLLKEKLIDYGFGFGDIKAGLTWLLVLIPFYALAPLLSAYIGTEHYCTYLVEPKFLKPLHIAIHYVSYMMVVFGFEFLFRGFVLFGLNKGMGDTTITKWISAFLSGALAALCFIGLPWVFPVGAFLSSLAAGFLNFRLRSFLYLAVIHWNLGVWSDTWEIIKMNIANGNIF